MSFAVESQELEGQNQVERILKNKLNDNTKCDEILQLLKRVEKWCAYRNEIVHSLMNKNLESLQEQIKQKAIEGNDLFRKLDNYVSWIKRKRIRVALKLDA